MFRSYGLRYNSLKYLNVILTVFLSKNFTLNVLISPCVILSLEQLSIRILIEVVSNSYSLKKTVLNF